MLRRTLRCGDLDRQERFPVGAAHGRSHLHSNDRRLHVFFFASDSLFVVAPRQRVQQ